MNQIITPFDVMEVNKLMAYQGIEAKLHLQDSCGGQSLWYEGANEEVDKAKVFVDNYFNKVRIDPSLS